MEELILGLDIGIASVGWGIINSNDGTIVDTGVRLFNSASANNNVERRNARQARRLLRRKKHRRKRIQHLLNTYNIQEPTNPGEYNPYKIRVKGLTQKLTTDEIYIALFHLIKRRGISYLDDVEDIDGKNVGDGIKRNQNALKKYYPCEIQLERFNTYGKVRGILEKEDQQLLNIFPTSAYAKEAKQIIQTQKQFYPQLDTDFENKYIEILTGKREYFIGPGNEKSRTDYGVYRTSGKTWDNLFEILIGKCTIYPEEFRAARASYTAQEFNLLNDLNNLTIASIEDGKLSSQQKENIIKTIKEATTVNMINIIRKETGCSKDDIKGTPTDKDKKTKFMNTFESYRKLVKEFQARELDTNILSREVCDQLAHIMTLNSEASEIRKQITKEALPLSSEMIEACIAIKKKYGTFFSKWHNFSLKAMKEMLLELYEESKNQQQIITERGLLKKSRIDIFKEHSHIPAEMIVEDIYNPIAARSVRQTIKVVNAVIKKYGTLSSIIVEMPREFISEDEEKKKIIKLQKQNEKEKNDALKRAREEYGFSDDIFNNQKNILTKIRLWYQQGRRCLYSGKTIPIQKLVHNPDSFDIDHIIPQSISYDDGLNNKALCYANENRNKGQKTPYHYMKSRSDGWTFEAMKSYISKDITLSDAKKALLTMEEDINKWEVRQRFIARNLVDTRYASRVVLNGLQDYMKAKNNKTNIYTIRGKITSQLRRHWKIQKNREESFSHHAKDALIIAAASKLKLWNKMSFYEIQQDGLAYKKDTGEILPVLTETEYSQNIYQDPFVKFINDLKTIDDKVKYSHMVSKKENRKVSDATIYSTRNIDDKEYIVSKIKDIYNINSYKRFKNIYDKDKSKFLMYKHDNQTFRQLEKAMEVYVDCENPFEEYKKEFGPFKKYSKKGNGAEIYDIKYLYQQLGQYIDITNDTSEKKKIVLLSINPYRADVYFDTINKQYRIIGVKYSMFKFKKDSYQINQEKYQKLLEDEKINQDFKFCFSLYRGDMIEFGDINECKRYRFWSKSESGKNRIEVKPVDFPEYEKRNLPSITSKTTIFNKYHTDILGNTYLAPLEKDPRTIE